MVGAIGERTNVVLVGHSFGGMVVRQVAEAIPSKISKLVYLAGRDEGSLFGKYVTPTPTALVFNPDGLGPVFCNDCTPGDVAMLRAKLRPEPLAPFATPVTFTAANYGSMRKYDILTKRDQAVSYAFQKMLQARLNPVKSVELGIEHLPFFSKPNELAKVLEGH